MTGPTPSAPKKISLARMIAQQQSEVDTLDTWESVHRSEGNELPATMAERRAVARATLKTLLLVEVHQHEFIRMVEARREAGTRAARIRGTDVRVPESERSSSETG